MTENDYKQAGDIMASLREKRAELELVNHLLDNAPGGVTKVRVDGRWTIQLPVATLRGGTMQRKNQLESEISDLENQLNML